MEVETTVKRIGGSTFALLPPELVRVMGLKSGDKVALDVRPPRGSAAAVLRMRGTAPGAKPFTRKDRIEMWGERDL